MNAFFLDEIPWQPDRYIISNHFDEIETPMIHTSYQLLQARLVNMTYKEYMEFCRDSLGAEVMKQPNQRWAAIHFKDTPDVRKFVGILNTKFDEGYIKDVKIDFKKEW